MKTALIAGATGLIGKQLLELLVNSASYQKIYAITRKPLAFKHHKLENQVMNFDTITALDFPVDDVFCCLGTTMKKAKSKEAFRRVDYTYPLTLAQVSRASGARQYFLVSALGANKNSSVFYNQVKGEIEEAIDKVGFFSYHIFRPSLLLGPREEHRSGEDAAKTVYNIFGFLIPSKYKAIDSFKIAKAMIHYARKEQEGKYIHESKDLQKF